MTARKWTPARVVKIWLDVILALGCLAWVVLALYMLTAPWLVSSGDAVDFGITVAIGPHSFLPRMPLELYQTVPNTDTEIHRAQLVKGYGELRMDTRSWGLHFASMLLYEVALLLVVYAVWVLREVMKSVLAGEPFTSVNSRRLRRIGFIILAATVVFPVPEYLIGKAILADLNVAGLTLSPAFRIPTDWILGGLLFLVLGAIFRHGTDLEQEQALTV